MKFYTLIEDDDRKAFQRDVAEFLNKGWVLAGGISITFVESSDEQRWILYAQALTKETE